MTPDFSSASPGQSIELTLASPCPCWELPRRGVLVSILQAATLIQEMT
jgi:flagellar biosynthesis protein FliQ